MLQKSVAKTYSNNLVIFHPQSDSLRLAFFKYFSSISQGDRNISFHDGVANTFSSDFDTPTICFISVLYQLLQLTRLKIITPRAVLECDRKWGVTKERCVKPV